ncbi:MAG: hypothetical protein HFF36_09820 [Coprobacillus sp.]|nr:hypothetical protein [Coprobacillus sp.]
MCKIFEEVEQRGVKIGKEQGKKEGLIIGQQKGIEINKGNTIRRMLDSGRFTYEDICISTGITEEEIHLYI